MSDQRALNTWGVKKREENVNGKCQRKVEVGAFEVCEL